MVPSVPNKSTTVLSRFSGTPYSSKLHQVRWHAINAWTVVTSAKWQETPCDSIWHVSSRRCDCCKQLYSIYFTLLTSMTTYTYPKVFLWNCERVQHFGINGLILKIDQIHLFTDLLQSCLGAERRQIRSDVAVSLSRNLDKQARAQPAFTSCQDCTPNFLLQGHENNLCRAYDNSLLNKKAHS